MRRVAATTLGETGAGFRPDDRIGLRLAGRSLELTVGSEVKAGRGADCDLLIDDRLCSRQHAAFSRAPDGGVLVRDLGSTNGTYVNGVRVYGSHRLARGDWTTIGNETLELCVLPATAQAVSPTIPAGPGRDAPGRAAARSGSKTDPGSPLLSLASLAATAAGRTAAAVRADAARKPLDALLRRLRRGETIAEPDAQMAGMVALSLCKSTSEPVWLDYLFGLYTALRLPLPAPLLERLSDTLSRVGLADPTSLRVLLEVLERSPRGVWSEPQQQLIARLAELLQQHGCQR